MHNTTLRYLICGSAIGCLLVVTFYVGFAYYFNWRPGGPKEWSEFATFFSGIVTPILAFTSIVILSLTLNSQAKLLEQQREAAELQDKLFIQKALLERIPEYYKAVVSTLPHRREDCATVFREFLYFLVHSDLTTRNNMTTLTQQLEKVQLEPYADELEVFSNNLRNLTASIYKYTENGGFYTLVSKEATVSRGFLGRLKYLQTKGCFAPVESSGIANLSSLAGLADKFNEVLRARATKDEAFLMTNAEKELSLALQKEY